VGTLIAALEALRHPKSRACVTTEVVPFLGLALFESLEGWGCGIPPFGFAQGRLLRKVREGWGTLARGGVGLQQVQDFYWAFRHD
jgi:hypothetical protein